MQLEIQPQSELAPLLVCLAYAGGSASVFAPWRQRFPTDALQVIQYPGRAGRFSEPPPGTIAGLAQDALVQLRPRLASCRPIVLFGHSMGALVAFEVAHRLRLAGADVRHLFVSGRKGPRIASAGRSLHLLADDPFLDHVARYGGISEVILRNADARRLFARILKADFHAVETYQAEWRSPLSCPITVLQGEHDNTMTDNEARAWSAETTASCEVILQPGGHLFLLDRWDAIADLVLSRVTQAPPVATPGLGTIPADRVEAAGLP